MLLAGEPVRELSPALDNWLFFEMLLYGINKLAGSQLKPHRQLQVYLLCMITLAIVKHHKENSEQIQLVEKLASVEIYGLFVGRVLQAKVSPDLYMLNESIIIRAVIWLTVIHLKKKKSIYSVKYTILQLSHCLDI